MLKPKGGKGTKPTGASSETISDPRFTSFATDPRFRLPSKQHARTKIDKRFSRMLKDEDFSNTAKVDRYGRKLSSSGKKLALQRLYQPEEEEEEEEDEHEVEDNEEEDGDVEIEVEDDEVVRKELKRLNAIERGYDPARGGGFSSSEDDDEEDEELEAEVNETEHFPDMQEEQADVPMGEVSTRLAVVNMDWDNIRAVDLMAVFQSFLPAGGRLQSMRVYKSEFGKERMEREEMEGPPKEIFAKSARDDDSEDEDDSDDGSETNESDEDDEEAEDKIKKSLLQEDSGAEFDSGALRQYQLERLRYFYGVLTCSSTEVSQAIYTSCDGAEYLSSANFFDLRFVPDDVTFDDEPRDECESVPTGYRPTEFVTDALQHSKVKLTWDAEDGERKDVIKRAFAGSRAEISSNDLKAYLGSDSSDSEDEEPEKTGEDAEAPKLSKKDLARQKMRAALGLADEPTPSSKSSKPAGPVGDMQITFAAGLSTKDENDKSGVFQNKPIVEETTAEAYVRKEKERKARRKEKARLERLGLDPKASTGDGNGEEKADEENDGDEGDKDLGFDDPFFTQDDEAKAAAAKTVRKEERKKKRDLRAAEDEAKAAQRAELELLMADNTNVLAGGEKLDHFDIKEIARMEKAARKKGKKGKRDFKDIKKNKDTADTEAGSKEKQSKRGGIQEGFEMDVQDPRFKAVFESHEYAIDPSNPKFKGTEGMKKLLEEGRRKRKGDVLDDEDAGDDGRKEKDSASGSKHKGAERDGLQGLVESVKKKAKR